LKALANNATSPQDLEVLTADRERPADVQVQPPYAPVVSIPTSLSGGEYQSMAGGTEDATRQKHPFKDPIRGPVLVILDPELTTTTPDQYWLSTGIRAVDHCVETMCSLQSTDEADRVAAEGLKMLVPGLLRCKKDKKDLEARLHCQLGVIKAMEAVKNGVPMGGSHAIGHQLGPLGVGHGETSCVMLPTICKFNAKVNVDRQEKVKDVLWADEEVKKVLQGRGLDEQVADLGDMLDGVISELGMPRSLKAVNVGKEQFDKLAMNSLKDHWSATNPIPLVDKDQIIEILEVVAG